jgi:hypothetical protein
MGDMELSILTMCTERYYHLRGKVPKAVRLLDSKRYFRFRREGSYNCALLGCYAYLRRAQYSSGLYLSISFGIPTTLIGLIVVFFGFCREISGLPNSVEQNASLEAHRYTVGQEFPHISWNRKFIIVFTKPSIWPSPEPD